MEKKRKIPLLLSISLVLSILGVLALSILGIQILWPSKIDQINQNYEFWKKGVARVEVNGLKGYVRDTCSEGEPSKRCQCTLLIHDLGETALSWREILTGDLKSFPTRLKMYAFHLPGVAGNPKPESAYYRSRELASLLRKTMLTECQTWMVVGNGFGGWIATWMALDFRSNVQKLILIASTGLDSKTHRKIEKLLGVYRKDAFNKFLDMAFVKPKRLRESDLEVLLEQMKLSRLDLYFTSQVKADQLAPVLNSVRVPTLLLWGKEDQLSTLRIAREFRSKMPGAIYREIDSCGHFPQLECPIVVFKTLQEMANFGMM